MTCKCKKMLDGTPWCQRPRICKNTNRLELTGEETAKLNQFIPIQCQDCGLTNYQEPTVRERFDYTVRCISCEQKHQSNPNSRVGGDPKPASNPKTRDSSHKVPLSLCPPAVRVAIARVLKIGGEKPGRWHWNWRDQPVKMTQYIDAIHRHLSLFESGEDLDEEMTEAAGAPIHHLDAAASSLAILIDAREAGTLIDDRPKNGSGAAEMLKRFQSVKSSK